MGRTAGVVTEKYKPKSTASFNLTGKHAKGFVKHAPPVGKRVTLKVKGKVVRHGMGDDYHDMSLDVDGIEPDADDAPQSMTGALKQRRMRSMAGM